MPSHSNHLMPLERRQAVQSPAPLDLLSLVGAEGWARLPVAVQRRFGAEHHDVSYAGQMALRCSRMGGLFARLSRLFGSPLCARCESQVATCVRVQSDACGGVIWERHFLPTVEGGPEQVVRSTKRRGPDGQLQEHTDGGLGMSLDVFEADGALVFQSTRFFLQRGSLVLPLPAWLTPGVCRVSHEDLGRGQFRFTLSMTHPWWGETFYQSGVFTDPVESLS